MLRLDGSGTGTLLLQKVNAPAGSRAQQLDREAGGERRDAPKLSPEAQRQAEEMIRRLAR